jgi:hypothetical protein
MTSFICSQPLLILRTKATVFLRLLKQMPLIYSILLFLAGAFFSYILLKIDVPMSWKSLLPVVGAYIFLCSRVRYRNEKVWLLKQYPRLLFSSYVVDFLLISVPFFLLNPVYGIIACVVAIIYAIFRSLSLRKLKINVVIPSPFFLKSSFLWHAQMRYLFPCALIFILIFIIIGRLNENPNLAFVAFGGGAFLACLTTIFQSEKRDFIQIYINEYRFLKQTLIETVRNTIVFMLPPTMAMFFLFPDKLWVTLLIVFSVILLNINALWIKYAFYPSQILASVLFLVSLTFLGALATTIYGLVLVPLYYIFVFQLCKKNIRQILFR